MVVPRPRDRATLHVTVVSDDRLFADGLIHSARTPTSSSNSGSARANLIWEADTIDPGTSPLKWKLGVPEAPNSNICQ